MRTLLLVYLVAFGVLFGAISTATAEQTVTGRATYRERIALPPDAVFKATLEDVSRAGAPASVIGQTTIENPGQPPVAFSIAYDPATIDERFTYAVRTRIEARGQLLFTSDTVHRVLTHGAPSSVEIVMRKVGGRRATTDTPATADVPTVLGGMFVYLADAARLTDCRSGNSYPVSTEGDYLSLERAYLAARANPGDALMVTVEGMVEPRPRMEGEGTEPSAIVRRFINVWPGETCERNRADASLVGTYWRIVRLGDETVATGEGKREPHIVLQSEDKRFNATVGCNQMVGGYELNDSTLRFGATASTMMACPPPLDQLERRLGKVLADTASWRIYGQFLEVFAADGRPLALLQAVYLK